MARKGEDKTQKRLSAPRVIKIERKKHKWILNTKAGQHKKAGSMPLGLIIRDKLGLAVNLREVKIALARKAVLVNGVSRKSTKFAVGLFDVISLPEQKKAYRLVLDSRGRFQLQEIDEKEAKVKLSKITGKRAGKKGIIQLETNDGRTISEKKTDLVPGDSILITLPEQKITKELKLGKGSTVYIVAGEHASELAKVKEVVKGTMKRPRLVELEEKDSSFLTVAKNVFVVGKEKPEINLKV